MNHRLSRSAWMLLRHAPAIGLWAVLAAGLAPPAAAQSSELDRVVAIVNNDVIVLSELQSRVRTIRVQLKEAGTPEPPTHVLERQVLEKLVMDRLQLQVAAKNGVIIDETALNNSMQTLAAQNGLSLREFRDILERDGYDFARFREQVRDELTISRLQQQQLSNRVTVTDREIENYLTMQQKQGGRTDQYRLSHILIAVPDGATPEEVEDARLRATEVLERLRDGEPFAQLAVSVSDGQNALEGGSLGWRKASELPTVFADLVPQMNAGEVSDLVRSASGFHIVKLDETRGEERHLITQTNARHILIRTDTLTSDQDARVRLEQLKLRIEGGDDFEVLARSHSDDRATAVNGGNLGWLSPGKTVQDFEDVMNTIAPGEVSAPFHTQFGWHIVQVLDRREHDDTDEVRRNRATDAIRRRKSDEELQTWLRQLRDEAYVELRVGG